jgi:L-asparaginase
MQVMLLMQLDANVIRVPVLPGTNPKIAYGDVIARGVKGIVLEAFGVGNLPDIKAAGWLQWLSSQMKKGLLVYLASQCSQGPLQASP